jgi:ADP-heptose:LPS heptosyltransferase
MLDTVHPGAKHPVGTWIDPTGGLGDMLMVSGALKLAYDRNPETRFGMVRRAIYADFFTGHPAIAEYGLAAPPGAHIISTDYWAKEPLGPGNQRPFQILARLFGVPTPVDETLFLSENREDGSEGVLKRFLPDFKNMIVMAPASDSPRKTMPMDVWEQTVGFLKAAGYSVVQVGRSREPYVRGALSMLGLTTPRQAISLAAKARAVLTVDNFIMHAAHLKKAPTVVLWGPTDAAMYGYPGQRHLSAPADWCGGRNACLGPDHPANYRKPCTLDKGCCMRYFSAEEICASIQSILS